MHRDKLPIPEEVDERLREWAYFFRDRRRLETCKSIEHRYRRSSDDADPDGWGDMESAPQTSPAPSYRLLRALDTHEVIQGMEKKYKWALTYGYCYPSLPKHLVTRLMKKYTGLRLTWTAYLEVLDIARMRVYALSFRVNHNI